MFIRHLAYYSLRKKFPELGAQMACNAIAKTAQALRALKEPKEPLFKKGGLFFFMLQKAM